MVLILHGYEQEPVKTDAELREELKGECYPLSMADAQQIVKETFDGLQKHPLSRDEANTVYAHIFAQLDELDPDTQILGVGETHVELLPFRRSGADE